MFRQLGLRARISSPWVHKTGSGCAGGKPRANRRAFTTADTQVQQKWRNATAFLDLLKYCHKNIPSMILSATYSFFRIKNDTLMTMISQEYLASLPLSHSFQQFLSRYHSWICTWLFSLINSKGLEQRKVNSVILASLVQCTVRSRWSINIHFH